MYRQHPDRSAAVEKASLLSGHRLPIRLNRRGRISAGSTSDMKVRQENVMSAAAEKSNDR